MAKRKRRQSGELKQEVIKLRDKVTFTYKPGRGDHGHIYNNIDKISDDHLKVIQNAVNGEIVRRRELVDHPELKPEKNSFFKKLRRFIRRLNAEIMYHAETTAVNHIVGSEQACNSPYIGLIDETIG